MIRSTRTCRGITWERAIWRRRGLLRRTAAIVAAGMTGTLAGVLPANASATPLPDLASVEQVVGAPAAWQAGAVGTGVDVAVLDTGVTPVAGLNGPNKILYGPDLSFDSQDPNAAYLDNFGHGTAIASIIAGNDGVPGGFEGVAPNARIVSVKVGSHTGAVDVSQIIAGIDWVVQHAHDPGVDIRVLNLSLGTTSTQSYTIDPLAQAAENAWKHGITVVVSAGNDGTASNIVADPAIDPFLITVGAEDPVGTIPSADDTVPSFSQRGNGSRHPDLVAPGAYVMGLNVPGSALATQFPNAVFGRYIRGSGTSQAAAMVSGAVADVLSANPSWTPDQVKAALTGTATRIAVNNPNFVGAGLLNVPGAVSALPSLIRQGWSPALGTGSLELARGNAHVAYNGVTLTGEQDIFGNPWLPAVMVPAEQACTAWNGGIYNNGLWTGTDWSSVTWSSVTWSSVTWSSVTWSSVTWSSVTWSSVTWSSVTWSSALWASSSWA